jgi:dTDP-4-dehydrorhamnose 3,5-epimerase
MEVIKTKLEGCLIIQPKVFGDERGYFLETFNQKTFEEKTGLHIQFVQDNESKSSYGVVRGLHFQNGEHAQAKLVSVSKGKVLDVAVDIRKDSPTFMQYITIELSGENKTQLFIPRGFAHGFAVLEDDTVFTYKCDNFYNKQSEGGIFLGDHQLAIDWQVPTEKWIMSEKDKGLPKVEEYLQSI